MIVCALLSASTLLADKVKTFSSTTAKPGRVTEVTNAEVTLDQGSTKVKIPVLDIESVTFEPEPKELTTPSR